MHDVFSTQYLIQSRFVDILNRRTLHIVSICTEQKQHTVSDSLYYSLTHIQHI